MKYSLKYNESTARYDGKRVTSDIDATVPYIRYTNNDGVASAFGIITYNPYDAITLSNYDIYFPKTSSLPHVDSIRVVYGNIDTDTGEITIPSSTNFANLVSSDLDTALPETITVDSVTYYRHRFVLDDGSEGMAVPSGWCAQMFYACNLKSMGGDYDEWDDVANAIYPLCTITPGVAYNKDSLHYSGFVGRSSTVMYIRQNCDTVTYKRNYKEYPSATPDRWCIPTATSSDFGSNYNIFPYIHMNGLQL